MSFGEEDDVPRSVRRQHNRALFRDVNERIAGLAPDAPGQLQEFICECSHLGCAAHMLLPLSAYAATRQEATTFLVVPGHEDSEHDEVVVRLPQYLIVRSDVTAAALKRAVDAHRQAAAVHKSAADFHEEHAAGEHRLGNTRGAERMQRRADQEREREQQEQQRADDAQRLLDWKRAPGVD